MRIEQAWTDAVQELGGTDASASAGDLAARYAEPHRRYHTADHIRAVLDDCGWLAGPAGLTGRERALVAAAACAHDVVYDARPGLDERASVEWARGALGAAGVAPGLIERVAELILCTLTHVGTGDPAAEVLLDADLAVLGADEPRYDRYVAGVRYEYAAVPPELWRVGRSQVLSNLLERAPLYAIAAARTRWEAAARRNIARELAALAR